MNESELIKRVLKKSAIKDCVKKSFVQFSIEKIKQIMIEHISSGGNIAIRRFGYFKVIAREECIKFNPLKMEFTTIKPCHHLRYKPSKKLLKRLIFK